MTRREDGEGKQGKPRRKQGKSKRIEDNPLEPMTDQVGEAGGCQGVVQRAIENGQALGGMYAKLDPQAIGVWRYQFGWPIHLISPLQPALCQPTWNSVLLFFNLADAVAKPGD